MGITYIKGSYKNMTLEERQECFNNIAQYLKENGPGPQFDVDIKYFIEDIISHISSIVDKFIESIDNVVNRDEVDFRNMRYYFDYCTVECHFMITKDLKHIRYFQGYTR
ncbi:MAG: hypothetical protein K2M17_04660, partial [Bacilli bacterium]|nr:hypothetical protein [Bacilli bacterium]